MIRHPDTPDLLTAAGPSSPGLGVTALDHVVHALRAATNRERKRGTAGSAWNIAAAVAGNAEARKDGA